MFEAGLVYLLNNNAALSALVATRIYPVQSVPDNPSFPYVTYQDVGGGVDYTFEAEGDRRRVQFDIWSATYGAGKSIAQALRNALSGVANTVLNDGTVLIFAERMNYLDNFDVDQRSYRSIAEYEFEISEP